MISITIDLDVQDPVDVVKKQKGKFKALAANFLMSRENLKSKVEEAIAGEMVKAMRDNIQRELAANGVKAYLNISIKHQNK